MDLVRRGLGLAMLLSVAACGPEIGPTQPWVDVDDIQGVLRPEWADPPAPLVRPDPRERLRIVTYNVHKGENVEGIARSFADDVELAQAQVVMVQEIEDHPGEDGSRASRLAALLGMGFVYAPERVEGDGTHGTALLSVFPLANVQVMQLPHIELPWSSAQRIALGADVVVGSMSFRVVTVHLDTRLNVPQRILQLRPAIIDEPERTIVGGDFNTNTYIWAEGSIPNLPVESVVGADHQALALDDYMRALRFTTPTANSGSTQHTAVLDSRLDSIFVRSLSAQPGRVEREIGLSDHFPLWVDVFDRSR
jgi:endonuclease/exonuclease/phosphatase family metal-dependent hydrolase